jgi:hypothetical protein
MSPQTAPRPAELPDLAEELQAAAATAMAAYDLPTARLRLQQRLRSEGGRATTHRRWVVALAASAAVVLVGAVALLSHRPEASPNPAVGPGPTASSSLTAAGIPVGVWRADASHFDEGNFHPTFVFLTVRPDSTGTVNMDGINENVDVRFRRADGFVRVETDPSLCPAGLLFALDLTVRSDELVVNAAQPGPCFVDPSTVESLVGATFLRQDQP